MDNPKSNYKFNDFPVGRKVMIISKMVDFHFFYNETGAVIKNSGNYLGIAVKFDKPRHYADGYIMKEFNFNPNNLKPLLDEKEIKTDYEKQLEYFLSY